jgi:hypothetical protein
MKKGTKIIKKLKTYIYKATPFFDFDRLDKLGIGKDLACLT